MEPIGIWLYTVRFIEWLCLLLWALASHTSLLKQWCRKIEIDFNGSSQSFNVLASYLFSKVFARFKKEVRYLPCFPLFHWIFWITTQCHIVSSLYYWHVCLQNIASEQMEMTKPVFIRKGVSNSEAMDMTWHSFLFVCCHLQLAGTNSFVMPAKYDYNLPCPKDPSDYQGGAQENSCCCSLFRSIILYFCQTHFITVRDFYSAS
jgi:hypothetical protein